MNCIRRRSHAGKKVCEGAGGFHPGRACGAADLKFRTEDGPAYIIDRIIDIRPAPSLKSGGQGMRYTCRVGEKMLFLFHDRTHWFVETVDQA